MFNSKQSDISVIYVFIWTAVRAEIMEEMFAKARERGESVIALFKARLAEANVCHMHSI